MPTEKLEFYKCNVCGNLIQVILSGTGELVCCGQKMNLQVVQHDSNELGEKHAPKLEYRDTKKIVQVMSHPMVPEHYVEFIEVYNKNKTELHLKYFKPCETPEFDITYTSDDIEAVEFCNIHGLWGENKDD